MIYIYFFIFAQIKNMRNIIIIVNLVVLVVLNKPRWGWFTL